MEPTASVGSLGQAGDGFDVVVAGSPSRIAPLLAALDADVAISATCRCSCPSTRSTFQQRHHQPFILSFFPRYQVPVRSHRPVGDGGAARLQHPAASTRLRHRSTVLARAPRRSMTSSSPRAVRPNGLRFSRLAASNRTWRTFERGTLATTARRASNLRRVLRTWSTSKSTHRQGRSSWCWPGAFPARQARRILAHGPRPARARFTVRFDDAKAAKPRELHRRSLLDRRSRTMTKGRPRPS